MPKAPGDPGTLGTVRLRVTSIRPGGPIFVGIARTADVARYLNGVERERVSDLVRSGSRIVPGGPPPGTPGDQSFWVASSEGAGTRTLIWSPSAGSWTAVVMNVEGTPGIDVRADVGATVPALPWVSAGLLIGGALFILGGVALVVFAVRSR